MSNGAGSPCPNYATDRPVGRGPREVVLTGWWPPSGTKQHQDPDPHDRARTLCHERLFRIPHGRRGGGRDEEPRGVDRPDVPVLLGGRVDPSRAGRRLPDQPVERGGPQDIPLPDRCGLRVVPGPYCPEETARAPAFASLVSAQLAGLVMLRYALAYQRPPSPCRSPVSSAAWVIAGT